MRTAKSIKRSSSSSARDCGFGAFAAPTRTDNHRSILHDPVLMIDDCCMHLQTIDRPAREVAHCGMQGHHDIPERALGFISFRIVDSDALDVRIELRRPCANRTL